MEKRLWTAQEMADYANISRGTIYKWICEFKASSAGPRPVDDPMPYTKWGRSVRFDFDAVMEWAKKHGKFDTMPARVGQGRQGRDHACPPK